MSTPTQPPESILGMETIQDDREMPLFVGLMGPPNSGKTESAATFPEPIFVALERITSERIAKRSDVRVVRFYDTAFCMEMQAKLKLTGNKTGEPINRRDIVKYWLISEVPKLKKGQTLILDTWTTLQDAFDIQTQLPSELVYTKQGAVDDFAFWDRKIEYSKEICSLLQGASCHVVITWHEQQERDKVTGQLLNKIQPLMQGKFVTMYSKYYTNFFRMVNREEVGSDGKPVFDEKKVKKVEYLWQTRTDNTVNLKNRHESFPFLVPATYESFVKYCGYPTALKS